MPSSAVRSKEDGVGGVGGRWFSQGRTHFCKKKQDGTALSELMSFNKSYFDIS